MSHAETPNSSQVGQVLEGYRDRLRRMVTLRMDPRLRGRCDASDVLQEAFMEVIERLPKYEPSAEMPFFIWVRAITGQRLLQVHRHHLGARMRDARLEVRREYGGVPHATSLSLAHAIAASGMLSPSGAAVQEERHQQLESALEQLKPEDREVIALRHFEHLTNVEVAAILGLSEPGASLRHARALRKLHGILKHFQQSEDGPN